MSKTKDIVLGIAEIALLVLSFGLLIPEVPSERGHVYHLFPGLSFATLLFALSQYVSIYRERRSWWALIAKTLLFVVFGWLLFERFRMGPMT